VLPNITNLKKDLRLVYVCKGFDFYSIEEYFDVLGAFNKWKFE
jgi:hypothetical protein